MKRNANSSRSKKWFERNNLDNNFCREYVNRLCETQFEFNIYSFGIFNGLLQALYVTYGLYSYVIFADNNSVSLKVMEQNSNEKEKNRYHELKEFYGDNCWYECLLWINNRI